VPSFAVVSPKYPLHLMRLSFKQSQMRIMLNSEGKQLAIPAKCPTKPGIPVCSLGASSKSVIDAAWYRLDRTEEVNQTIDCVANNSDYFWAN
jgi:hypothetical protein